MKSAAKLGLLLTGALVMTTGTGCSFMGLKGSSAEVAPVTNVKSADRAAKKAGKFLDKGDAARGLAYAEAAVEAAPASADMRLLLGRAYLANGRFLSAERSYIDAIELGGATPRNVISLALARIGQGKVGQATSLLNTYRADLPVADYGLAMALAGEADISVNVLTDAIRTSSADARTRQNLALAYALAGNWKGAKIMALQDLAEPQAQQRIAEWALIARPGAYQERVASILDVTPQADPGQPERLALNAAAAPVSAEAVAPEAMTAEPAELAAVGPAPAAGSRSTFDPEQNRVEESKSVRRADVPASTAAAKPAASPVNPVETAAKVEKPAVSAPAKPRQVAMVDSKSVEAPEPKRARSMPSGTHLVQLGAFSTPQNARAAWDKLSARHKGLGSFQSASSMVTINGKTLYRLAAVGFGNESSAKSFCSQIKAERGACIVRSFDRGASANRLASR